MREVLFRGKTKYGGEWIEGYFAKPKFYLEEKEIVGIFPVDLTLFPHSEFSEFNEVVPETVGQYTGLTDRNGKRIFEGDIVIDIFLNSKKTYIVKFTTNFNCGFAPFCEEVHGGEMELLPQYCEVIGNIHDNPELLSNN